MTKTIVRVNWNVRFRRRPKTHAQRTNPDWYQYRWDLWKQYTEPSLLRQTYGDFEVWLRCDRKLRSFTRWMETSLPDKRFKVTYNWNINCRFLAKSKPERVVMIRIDNDDAYAADALETYHAAIPELGDKNTIQLAEGWVWDHKKNVLFESANPSPAFMALVGDWTMVKERFPAMGNHSEAQYTAHRVLGHKWLMVVHGNNVCNRAFGGWVGRKVTGDERRSVLAEYGIKELRDGR